VKITGWNLFTDSINFGEKIFMDEVEERDTVNLSGDLEDLNISAIVCIMFNRSGLLSFTIQSSSSVIWVNALLLSKFCLNSCLVVGGKAHRG